MCVQLQVTQVDVVCLQVYIQYVKQVRAVDPQFVAINRDLDELLRVADELAVHASSYPSLTDICPGQSSSTQWSTCIQCGVLFFYPE